MSTKASLWKVTSQVESALASYHNVITWHARRTWDGKIEVLIAENGAYTGIASQEAVDVLSHSLTGSFYTILEFFNVKYVSLSRRKQCFSSNVFDFFFHLHASS